MYKIMVVLAIMGLSLSARASDLNKISQYWKTCPDNKESFYQKLQVFDQLTQDHFAGKKTDILVKIYQSNSKESRYLSFYAPYLLPSGILAAFDKECWAILQDSVRKSQEKNLQEADERFEAWKSCIETQYKKSFPEVDEIVRCKK